MKFHFPSTACLSVFVRPNNFLFYFLPQFLFRVVTISISTIIILLEKRYTVWAFSNASNMLGYVEEWARFVWLSQFCLLNSISPMLSSALPCFRRFLIVGKNFSLISVYFPSNFHLLVLGILGLCMWNTQ